MLARSPAAIEETLSTLFYATRAKSIVNTPCVVGDPADATMLALQREARCCRPSGPPHRARRGRRNRSHAFPQRALNEP